jgi:nucleoside-diphosphate-sugar epimerase
MTKTALVIGGTGPTGPHIVEGLFARGYSVAMLHSGRHEVASMSRHVEHLHTDPFDAAAVSATLATRTFDLAIVTYGRLNNSAALLHDRVGKFVSIGAFAAYRGAVSPDPFAKPPGTRTPIREDARLASSKPGIDGANSKLAHIVQAEQAVFAHHPSATHFRYSMLYGPRHPRPFDWMIVRRALDRRREIILPDGGITLRSRAFARNAAAAVMCALDCPQPAAGETFNVSDEWTPTLGQLVEMIGGCLGHAFEIVSMPYELATPSHPFLLHGDSDHRVTPPDKIRRTLNYRDVVDVETAVTTTARWLAAHRLTAAQEAPLGDPFDYDTEDRLIATWRKVMSRFDESAPRLDLTFQPRYSARYDRIKQSQAQLNDPRDVV